MIGKQPPMKGEPAEKAKRPPQTPWPTSPIGTAVNVNALPLFRWRRDGRRLALVGDMKVWWMFTPLLVLIALYARGGLVGLLDRFRGPQ